MLLALASCAAAQEQVPSPLPSPLTPALPAELEITLDKLVRRVSENSPQATIACAGVEAARQRVNARLAAADAGHEQEISLSRKPNCVAPKRN